ncbi:MAG: hypothetical protein ABI035_03475 [Gemmatimonadaceae bacterium]
MQWLDFAGSWLLVIGALYQAAIELRDHEMTGERFSRHAAEIRPPEPISAWWWFAPPIRMLLAKHRWNAYMKSIVGHMEVDDRRAALGFYEKAVAWLVIAGGATTLAIKETLSIESLSGLLSVGLAVAMAIVSVGIVIVQLHRRARAIRAEYREPTP